MFLNRLDPRILTLAKQIFDDNAVLVHLEKGIRKILDGKQINSFRRKADEEIHLVFCVAGTKYFYLFHKAISFLGWGLDFVF